MSHLISPKLKLVQKKFIAHWCPGCHETHLIRIMGDVGQVIYSFDFDEGLPSFSPSVAIFTQRPRTIGELTTPEEHVMCHYSLRHGIIQYFGDSLHHLAGKAIPLPDFPNPEKGVSHALP